MPPIRKGDGTPVEPKGVSQIRTGDGRILFDGPAIPDPENLHHGYDSTLLDLSDNDSVSPWSDFDDNVGPNDLTAGDAPTYREDQLNGDPIVDFDTSNYLETNFNDVSPPYTRYIVFKYDDAGSFNNYVLDGGSDNEALFRADGDDDWQIGGLRGGSPDTDWHIASLRYDTDGYIRIDGSVVASGDTSPNSLSGITMGSRFGGSNNADISVRYHLGYSVGHDANTAESVEEFLSNQTGVALS